MIESHMMARILIVKVISHSDVSGPWTARRFAWIMRKMSHLN